jgi:predicted DNA binding CopG/RHH family protein
MSVSIEVSNEQLAALKAKAAAQGLTLQDWLKKLADEESEPTQPG